MAIKEKFKKKFDHYPTLIVHAPGRINLIGEHTDYNGGFVLPAAIDKGITFAFSARTDAKCSAVAADLKKKATFSLENLKKEDGTWTYYLKGVIEQLQKMGHHISGFNVYLEGNIPTGAGLSSSAAVETGMAYALDLMNNLNLPKLELVKLCQRAENQFVGLQCGIMDMFASMMGRKDAVIRLDCRSLEYEYFPFVQDEYSIVLCDTGVKHSLADSEYNTRRQECERGVAILQKHYPEIKFLREVSPDILAKHEAEFDNLAYQRSRYVVSETVRTLAACEDLQRNDLVAFGQKMYETHRGLQHDYAVSCKELDFLVDTTEPNNEVAGARMMGGGFGGCTINLVKKEAVQGFITTMKDAYKDKFGKQLKCYQVVISEGTSIVL